MAVLFFLTITVVCAFAVGTSPTVMQLNPAPDQAQIPGKLDFENRTVDSQLIRSVFVPKAFSYAVVQQPENNPFYVSSSKKLVTEFGLAKQYNNIGLLAHNNLAGGSFESLSLGQEIYIVYKDGHADRFTVSEIYRFRALEPTNIESQFLDLESSKIFTATELFEKMYMGALHVTLQTCINARGDSSWGRLFVIAIPVTAIE